MRAPPRIAHYVYFMRPIGAEGPVKIGCSALLAKRLLNVSVWSPHPLEIAAQMPGYFDLEAAFHARFEHLWTHGEWFRPDAELSAVIAAVAAGTFDVSSLPPPKRLGRREHLPRLKWTDERKARVSLAMRFLRFRDRFPELVPDHVFRASWGMRYEPPAHPDEIEIVRAFMEREEVVARLTRRAA